MASLTQANLGFENLLRQFTSGTINPYLQGRRPDILHQEIDARTRRHLSRVFTPAGHPVWVDPGSAPGIDLTVDLDEDGPVRLNYTNTATQTPPYTGPSPAPEGFTRTPEETHNAICPNCEHELGTGDDPLRRQIWIAKPCGHVRNPDSLYLLVLLLVTNMLLKTKGLLRILHQTPGFTRQKARVW
jgi:hypothetical protein